MLAENEIRIQVYLAEREYSLGQFILGVISAKASNREYGKKHRIWFGRFEMTPQEELYLMYYNMSKPIVHDMDLVTLRAHIEELSKATLEARATLHAARDAERDKVAADRKSKGFSTSLQTDDVTSEAINRVRERGKKLTAQEKIVDQLMKIPGMDMATAQGIVSARNLKEVTDKTSELKRDNFRTEELKTPAKTNFVNPFAKVETKEEVEVSISEEATTVTITKTEPAEESKPKLSFVNPFAKG